MADLSTIIASLSEVNEGDLITSDYVNRLRLALQEMAKMLGASPSAGDSKLTFSPNFVPTGPVTNVMQAWQISDSSAAARQGASTTRGMLTLQLPDKARIQSITVVGRKEGAVDDFAVAVARFSVPPGQRNTLATIQLDATNGVFTQTVTLGASGAAGQDPTVVDNANYRYIVYATAENVTNLAEIYAIQVTLAR